MTLRDLRQELLGQLPVTWQPDPGEIIIGDIVRYEQRTIAGTPRVVCIIQSQGMGQLVSIPLRFASLINAFKNYPVQPPQVGERIGIQFVGPGGGGTFNLVVDRQDPGITVDWASL